MKTLILILAFFSTSAVASNHEYWRTPAYPALSKSNAEIQLQKEHRMLRGLQRELRETGQIAPKTPVDVYNLREGYGYDGGTSDYYRPYGNGY